MEEQLKQIIIDHVLDHWTLENEEPFKYTGDKHFSYDDIVLIIQKLQLCQPH